MKHYKLQVIAVLIPTSKSDINKALVDLAVIAANAFVSATNFPPQK